MRGTGRSVALRALVGLGLIAAVAVGFQAQPAFAASAGFSTLHPSGTAAFATVPQGVDGIGNPEIDPGAPTDAAPVGPAIITAPTVSGTAVKTTNPGLITSFQGLNFHDQRFANRGNQFSVEPPDQGLCAGNGFVLESVNDVLRVFHADGTPATGVTDLNTFYGYIPAINRSTGAFGPELTDPVCYFDPDTQHWFQVVLTLDRVGTTSTLSLRNHLDIAVSNTADPTGTWTIYKIDATDDGANGTPSHTDCPCIGDYPHIGADKYGVYITTNEYPWLTNGFNGAQIYAISKAQLAARASSVNIVHLDNVTVAGTHGFTVWPATAPNGKNLTKMNGTEFFLSSMAADEVLCPSGCVGPRSATRIAVWSLTNTASLDSAPSVNLASTTLGSEFYSEPPKANQKAGDFPLGQCINDTTTATPFGPGCWRFLFTAEPSHTEVISHLDSNDTRMQQVTYADGEIWGALDTAVNVGGQVRAGIVWFMVSAYVDGTDGSLHALMDNQNYVGVAHNNVTYPAIGVLSNGTGVMAFTLVGDDYYPSAGYVSLTTNATGKIHIAGAGVGPDDGFTSYKAEVGNPPRTRWGDYGATAVVGNKIWIASEYIAQTCTLAQYVASTPFGTCGGTRGALGNWSTRISLLSPSPDD